MQAVGVKPVPAPPAAGATSRTSGTSPRWCSSPRPAAGHVPPQLPPPATADCLAPRRQETCHSQHVAKKHVCSFPLTRARPSAELREPTTAPERPTEPPTEFLLNRLVNRQPLNRIWSYLVKYVVSSLLNRPLNVTRLYNLLDSNRQFMRPFTNL